MVKHEQPEGLHCVIFISSYFVFSQKKLQESSLKSVQKLKDSERELRYIVRYIKVSAFLNKVALNTLVSLQRLSQK